MKHPFAEKHNQFDSLVPQTDTKKLLCKQCGGNGYMKSSPNCYHTCLDCLGRGFINKKLNMT